MSASTIKSVWLWLFLWAASLDGLKAAQAQGADPRQLKRVTAKRWQHVSDAVQKEVDLATKKFLRYSHKVGVCQQRKSSSLSLVSLILATLNMTLLQ